MVEDLPKNVKELERLLGIFKGIIVYKKDQETLENLIIKYHYESVKLVKDTYPQDCIFTAYA